MPTSDGGGSAVAALALAGEWHIVGHRSRGRERPPMRGKRRARPGGDGSVFRYAGSTTPLPSLDVRIETLVARVVQLRALLEASAFASRVITAIAEALVAEGIAIDPQSSRGRHDEGVREGRAESTEPSCRCINLAHGQRVQMVCYGLGPFADNPPAQLQLSLALGLRDALNSSANGVGTIVNNLVAFDPLTPPLEAATLAALGVGALPENEQGKRAAGGVTTLFFAPHCPMRLYSNILWANWGGGGGGSDGEPAAASFMVSEGGCGGAACGGVSGVGGSSDGGAASGFSVPAGEPFVSVPTAPRCLSDVLILGNSLVSYGDRLVSAADGADPTNCVLRVLPLLRETRLEPEADELRHHSGSGSGASMPHLERAFSDLALTVFPRDLLAGSAAAALLAARPPEYLHEGPDGELVTGRRRPEATGAAAAAETTSAEDAVVEEAAAAAAAEAEAPAAAEAVRETAAMEEEREEVRKRLPAAGR